MEKENYNCEHKDLSMLRQVNMLMPLCYYVKCKDCNNIFKVLATDLRVTKNKCYLKKGGKLLGLNELERPQ